jgi:hypothetical protein
MGDQPDDVSALDAEIEGLRRRTEDLLQELERRVETRVDGAKRGVERVKQGITRARELTDVRAQARSHPRTAAALGAGTLAVAGLGVWFVVARRADNRRLLRRVQRRGQAYRALFADPERALGPRGPSLQRRLLTAVVIAAATSLTRRLLMAKMR